MTTDRRPPLLTPTPANPLTVLIAGGPADVARELKAWLAPRGLRVANHWPSDKVKVFGRPIPAGTELVIILCKHMSHSACDAVTAACKRAGARRVLTVWNRSRLTRDLEAAGVKLAAPRPAFDPTPQREEADPEAARCVFNDNGHRCAAPAADGDTLCAAHRQTFDATQPSGPTSAEIDAAREACAATQNFQDAATEPPARPAAACPSAAAPAADAAPPDAGWEPWHVAAPTKGGQTWTPAHVEALAKIVEGGVIDGKVLVERLHAATGQYRSVAAIKLVLRGLLASGAVKSAPELPAVLERECKAQQVRRKAFVADEVKARRRGQVGAYVSRALAFDMLCRGQKRLRRLEVRLDTRTGLLVYRRDDALACRPAKAKDAPTKPCPAPKVAVTAKPAMPRPPKPRDRLGFVAETTDAELEARLEAELRAHPGVGPSMASKRCHADSNRVLAALDRLAAAGRAVCVPGANRKGGDGWGPAGWAPGKAPARTALRPRAARAAIDDNNDPATLAAAAAAVDEAVAQRPPRDTRWPASRPQAGDAVADVIAAIGDGRLDPARGAAVLAALRGRR